jgi:DNA-binding transcriptional ArsR family regulator
LSFDRKDYSAKNQDLADQHAAGNYEPSFDQHPRTVDTFRTVTISLASKQAVTALDRCEIECVEPERVNAVLEHLPEPQVFQDLAETFRGLSDPGRVRLISALLEAGELCVCDLAAVTGLSQTAVSHNLRLLRASRLVRYRKQGRNVFYSLDDAHIRLLLDVGLQHVPHGEEVGS